MAPQRMQCIHSSSVVSPQFAHARIEADDSVARLTFLLRFKVMRITAPIVPEESIIGKMSVP